MFGLLVCNNRIRVDRDNSFAWTKGKRHRRKSSSVKTGNQFSHTVFLVRVWLKKFQQWGVGASTICRKLDPTTVISFIHRFGLHVWLIRSIVSCHPLKSSSFVPSIEVLKSKKSSKLLEWTSWTQHLSSSWFAWPLSVMLNLVDSLGSSPAVRWIDRLT